MTTYRIVHTSEYRFSEPVTACELALYLQPRDTENQTVLSGHLAAEPLAAATHDSIDRFGNRCTHVQFNRGLQRLTLSSVHRVRVQQSRSVPARLPSAHSDALQLFGAQTELTRTSPPLAGFARAILATARDPLDAVTALTRTIHAEFAYDAKATDTRTTANTVFQQRRGVCQDFAHLAIACCRCVGLPARYVSGYLDTKAFRPTSPAISIDRSHAWFSVHLPQLGWRDFDPTLGEAAGSTHVVTAWGRDYSDVAPVTGKIEGGGSQRVAVLVDVSRC